MLAISFFPGILCQPGLHLQETVRIQPRKERGGNNEWSDAARHIGRRDGSPPSQWILVNHGDKSTQWYQWGKVPIGILVTPGDILLRLCWRIVWVYSRGRSVRTCVVFIQDFQVHTLTLWTNIISCWHSSLLWVLAVWLQHLIYSTFFTRDLLHTLFCSAVSCQ